MPKCMKLKWILLFSTVALLAMWMPTVVRADVRDNAQIFTQDAVDSANSDMKAMEKKHGKQLVVETFAAVPDDQKDAAKADPKGFFHKWMQSRGQELKVNGVYVLICMDPHKVEVGAGINTARRGEFTELDVANLRKQIEVDLHEGEYDNALNNAVQTVERAYTENIQAANSKAKAARDTGFSNGGIHSNYSTPTNTPPPYNPPFNPSYSSGNNNSGSSALGLSFGSLLCMIVGGVIIISLIRSIFRGGSMGGFGGGGGGYYPGNQAGNFGGGYGGGGYSGGGGGFGKGFLGGLLGGAVGSYAENRFEDRDNRGGNSGFFGGGSSSGDTSTGDNGSSSFDSGPSDAGQGFGDTSSGGDFGSSSDSGGESSGGDF